MAKRPVGRPPRGAIWLDDEGRYEHTQEYFDIRERAYATHREKSKIRARTAKESLQTARPHVFQKNRDTLDGFIRKSVHIIKK